MHPMGYLEISLPVVKFPGFFLRRALHIKEEERGNVKRGQRQAKHVTANPIVHHPLLGDGRQALIHLE